MPKPFKPQLIEHALETLDHATVLVRSVAHSSAPAAIRQAVEKKATRVAQLVELLILRLGDFADSVDQALSHDAPAPKARVYSFRPPMKKRRR